MDLYFGIIGNANEVIYGFKLSLNLKFNKEKAVEKVLESKELFLEIFNEASDIKEITEAEYKKINATR